MTYQEFFKGAYARLARDRVAERSTSGILDSARRAEALEADLHRRAAPPKFSPEISWAERADAWLGTINERMAELDAATPTKEQTMITVKFTVSSAGLYAMNSSHAAQKTFGICKVNGESTTNTKVSLEFKSVEDTEDFLRKLDLSKLAGDVEITVTGSCRVFNYQFERGSGIFLGASDLHDLQNKPVKPRIDWTKPLKHLGGLSVRYVETLSTRAQFKHLCIAGVENQSSLLYDDHGQPEIGEYAVTNRPEVKRVLHAVEYGSSKFKDLGPRNLALTWEDGKLIKAEVL